MTFFILFFSGIIWKKFEYFVPTDTGTICFTWKRMYWSFNGQFVTKGKWNMPFTWFFCSVYYTPIIRKQRLKGRFLKCFLNDLVNWVVIIIFSNRFLMNTQLSIGLKCIKVDHCKGITTWLDLAFFKVISKMFHDIAPARSWSLPS